MSPRIRHRRLLALLAIAVAAALVVSIATPASSVATLCLLGAGVVLGEFLVLRLERGAGISLSYAVLMVLASSFGATAYFAVVLIAEAAATAARCTDVEEPRWSAFVRRVGVAGATWAAFRVMWAATGDAETAVAVFVALATAAIAQVVADQAMALLAHGPRTLTARGRLAWLAVSSSGMLMAVGYRGIGEPTPFGLWGPLIFATPLVVAWYAFDRLDSETRAYRQTVEALAMAPELGGLAPPGHAERVATVAVAVGRELDLSSADLQDLETAALLHHLGQVTLDEPADSFGTGEARVAAVTSAMMRDIGPLAAAGNIVSGDTSDPQRRLAVQALQIANEYDGLTVRALASSDEALFRLRRAPSRAYDTRVVAALDRVLQAQSGSS